MAKLFVHSETLHGVTGRVELLVARAIEYENAVVQVDAHG
jgi:hypothetical protein